MGMRVVPAGVSCASSWTRNAGCSSREMVERRRSTDGCRSRLDFEHDLEIREDDVLSGAGSGAEAGSGSAVERWSVAGIQRRVAAAAACGMWSGCRWGRLIRRWWSGCGEMVVHRSCGAMRAGGGCDGSGRAGGGYAARGRGWGARSAAVTITGGERAERDGVGWSVPKQDLIAGVQVLLETGSAADCAGDEGGGSAGEGIAGYAVGAGTVGTGAAGRGRVWGA